MNHKLKVKQYCKHLRNSLAQSIRDHRNSNDALEMTITNSEIGAKQHCLWEMELVVSKLIHEKECFEDKLKFTK